MNDSENTTAAISPVLSTDGLCGCGRPERYMVTRNGEQVFACNKYMRCLTYDELGNALSHANSLLMAYREKRAVDGLNGRTWDASKHFAAEAKIEALEKTHNALAQGRGD